MVMTLGILRSGATWIPLNPRDSIADTAAILSRFGCDVVVFHSEFLSDVPRIIDESSSVSSLVCLDIDTDLAPSVESWVSRAPVEDNPVLSPDLMAAIFATGGTTGQPKGVTFCHRSLAAIVDGLGAVIDHPRPVYLAAAPLTHAAGRVCLGVMAMGGRTVVLPKFEPLAALEAIERERVTFTSVTPTMLYMLLDEPSVSEHDYSTLRQLVVGAAPVALDRLKAAITTFGPVVGQAFGQTEAPLLITHMHPSECVVDGRLASDDRLRSCGRPTPSSEVRIATEDEVVEAAGVMGEIAVRGAFVMDGYFEDPQLTDTVTRDGFHLTGDLGVLDADGYLTILGRRRDLIISGGFNIFPAEVEDALSELEVVYESAVFGLPDSKWGEMVCAAVQLHPGSSMTASEIIGWARDRLGAVKGPKRVFLVRDLPRNENGKVLKRILVERCREGGQLIVDK
jgi:acyl-CoA synthetase (AMP-forming)/AMP-acid ligase II